MASDEDIAVVDEELPAPTADDAQAPPARTPEKPPAAKQKRRSEGRKAAPKPEDAGDELCLAAHPRAARRVAEAKAWGAVAGFALGGYLSLPTHTLADAAVRALIAGIVGRTFVWAAAVFLWRRVVVAELRNAQHQLITARAGEQPAQAPER